jgi:hypothetical protein
MPGIFVGFIKIVVGWRWGGENHKKSHHFFSSKNVPFCRPGI